MELRSSQPLWPYLTRQARILWTAVSLRQARLDSPTGTELLVELAATRLKTTPLH
jgi:hypothetical protein